MDKNFLNDFPILRSRMNGHPPAYLDNSATTQKPESVVRAICGYYRKLQCQSSSRRLRIEREGDESLRGSEAQGCRIPQRKVDARNYFYEERNRIA